MAHIEKRDSQAAKRQPAEASKTTLQTLERVKAALNTRYGACRSWETVASEFGVSVGTAVRVAGGYEPKTCKVRDALHLPPLVKVEVCPVHGVAHPGTCPKVKPTPPAWVSMAATWLAGRECLAPPAVRVYGRGGKAVTW